MKRAYEEVDLQKVVLTQSETTCYYGTVRYKIDDALQNVSGYTLTENFKNAIRNLPAGYSQAEKSAYMIFLDDWGTVRRMLALNNRLLFTNYN